MPSDVSITGDDALTLDMVGQFTFCPRRFHLMYVEGKWADNAYTAEGRAVHRRVDQVDHLLPDAGATTSAGVGTSVPMSSEDQPPESHQPDDQAPVISRSVPLSSETLGLTAKLDLVSSDGKEAVPVETKRGRVPNNEQRSHDTHRVQLMAQGLLLREHGYTCTHGLLYFAGSRTRVTVPFTPELEAETRKLIEQAHRAAKQAQIPPPLDHSPKCAGCSLAGICLPDETLALRLRTGGTALPLVAPDPPLDDATAAIRRLYPPRPSATPLYVQTQGSSVGKSGESLIVKVEGEEVSRIGIKDVSQLVLCGNVQVSAQTMHLLCDSEIPVVFLSSGMYFYGIAHGITLRNAYDRAAQFAAAADPACCLELARAIVRDKAQNQRTQLRRNASPTFELDRALRDIDYLLPAIDSAENAEALLGIEGNLARIYFSQFGAMLKSRDLDSQWDFTARNRRPPKDPVNAMLSFAYALLAKECTVALLAEGLDPYWGFYHRPRHGRPALALDLMETFRPVIADSAVITALNTGMIQRRNFTITGAGCAMSDTGRKALLRAYEARLDQLITHPAFDYRCSWRTAIMLQARLLARYLRGDIASYENIITR